MSEQPAIEVTGLEKAYDNGLTRALNGVSLRVEAGEWVSLSGPSGCGKSTLLHLLAGLDRPTAGAIRVHGTALAALPSIDRYRQAELGLVFQFHHLLSNFTAAQNVMVAMVGSGVGKREQRERAQDALARVGLGEKAGRRPTELSGGERQRVAIARAFVNSPRVILADEPTGALDSGSTALVLDLFRDLRKAHGATILMVTHDPGVAAAGDRVVYMRDGQVVANAEAAHGAAAAAWLRGITGAT